MATTFRSQHLSIMRDMERDMSSLFGGLAGGLGREIARFADTDGVVPSARQYESRRIVDQRVIDTFVVPDGQGRVAFVEIGGQVVALSPYMRILWRAIQAAVRVPVEHHANIMRKSLPRDLLLHLDLASKLPIPPMVVEQFRPNPLAGYDAPHLWIDPAGYTLSDRIWRVSGNTRRQIDMMLEEGIRTGRSAFDMAKDLEQFLQPGRLLKRTKTPYGRDASYDAMRLARTEVSHAAASAAEQAAKMNPFVEGLIWNLSPSHPC